ncbi:MAG: sulfatase-like hydrolase/transferase [Pseudomonadota bacterium]
MIEQAGMKQLLRRGAILLLIGMIVLSVAWVNRVPLMLFAAGEFMRWRHDVGPFQTIDWADTQAQTKAGSDKLPNIVLIVADDLGWNDISLNGGGVGTGAVQTPNIDSIAQQGAVFTNGYAANGTCAPSRAALMSGRYGTRFGFEFTPTPRSMMALTSLPVDGPNRLRKPIRHQAERIDYEAMGMPGSERTIAELLADQGYRTIHIGKWHLGLENGMDPQSQGFHHSLLMAGGLYLPEDDPRVVNSKQEFDPIDRFLWAALHSAVSYNGQVFKPDIHQTNYFSREAVRAIDANSEGPFFLYLAYWAPHTPLQAPIEDYEALTSIAVHRERVYGGMVRALDRGVGQVLAALDKNGIADNTLVMFTSDNGGAGYIGLPDVNRPYRGWKITLFEGGIHVPYFIKWPSVIDAGSSYEHPVQHFDMYATAAAAGGASLPTDRIVDGVDLIPHLLGQNSEPPHRELFWRSGASQSALVDGWKLSISNPPGRQWLFNLKDDPTEQHDLSSQRPDKLGELQSALAQHNAQQAPAAWESQASFPINIDKSLALPDAKNDDFIYWSN